MVTKSYFNQLQSPNEQKLYEDLVPYTFTVLNNNGVIREFMNENIDPSRSYIQLKDATGITNLVYMIFECYIEPNN